MSKKNNKNQQLVNQNTPQDIPEDTNASINPIKAAFVAISDILSLVPTATSVARTFIEGFDSISSTGITIVDISLKNGLQDTINDSKLNALNNQAIYSSKHRALKKALKNGEVINNKSKNTSQTRGFNQKSKKLIEQATNNNSFGDLSDI